MLTGLGTNCMAQTIDKDQSGTITVDELKVGLKEQGSTVTEAELADLVKSLDADNSGTIDYEVGGPGQFVMLGCQLRARRRGQRLGHTSCVDRVFCLTSHGTLLAEGSASSTWSQCRDPDPRPLHLHEQEFLAGTLNLAALNKAENLKAAFESFDIDGDGKITREELQAGLKVGTEAHTCQDVRTQHSSPARTGS